MELDKEIVYDLTTKPNVACDQLTKLEENVFMVKLLNWRSMLTVLTFLIRQARIVMSCQMSLLIHTKMK